MDEDNNAKTISSNMKPFKSFTEPRSVSNKKIYVTDSNERKSNKMSDNSQKKRRFPRSISEKVIFDHYDKKNCVYCKGIDNLVKNDKSKLSIFIQDNSQYLKLFGNQRYNRSSPYLFVEDHKSGIDDRIGLVPIPSKPLRIMKSEDENHNLYEIQRKIVMIRRFQYGKRNLSEPIFKHKHLHSYANEDNLSKIILIQKTFRGYIIRKKVEFILNFKDIMNYLQDILDKLKAKKILRYLLNLEIKITPRDEDIKGYNYISKIRKNKPTELDICDDNIVHKNKNHKNEGNKSNDIFKNINDLKKFNKKIVPKTRVRNKSPILTKEFYDLTDTNDKLNKIENKYKEYINSKKNIIRKDNENGNNISKGLYIDKIYYSQLVQKVVNFSNLLRNALLKAVFRKKPKKIEINLEEIINDRIDIKPDIDKNKKKDDLENKIKSINLEKEKIFNSKDFRNDNKGFYIDIIRKKIIRKDSMIEIDIDLDKKKIEKKISKEKVIIPKNKYCYITKEYKIYKEKNKDDNKEKTKKGKNKDKGKITNINHITIDLDNGSMDKKENKNEIDNKLEISYKGKENISKDNPIILSMENNSNFNFLRNKKEINYEENHPKKSENKPIVLLPGKLIDFKYEGKELEINDNNTQKNKDLSMQPTYELYYLKTNEDKIQNLVPESNFNIIYEGKMKNIETTKEYIPESNSNIIYYGKPLEPKKDNTLLIQNNFNLIYKGNKPTKNIDSVPLIIENNNIINIKENIIDINNKLKMEKNENIFYENNNKDKNQITTDDNNFEKFNDTNFQSGDKKTYNKEKNSLYKPVDLIIVKNVYFEISKNFEEDNKNDEIRRFNENEITFVPINAIIYKGKNKDKNDVEPEIDSEKGLKDMKELEPINKLNNKICYISKSPKLLTEKIEEDILFKRKDIFNNNKAKNGLLITKMRYNKIKEKIYKKPLFNEFYSFFIEQFPEKEETKKSKAKPKKTTLKKKDSKEPIIPKEVLKNYNTEKSTTQKKPRTNKNLTEKEEPKETDSCLIKRIIPPRGSSEILRIKPNHLLKIIKVEKGKTTYEKYIHVGKLVPKKIKEEDEEFIYIRYKSKTPSKSPKKYIQNNLLKNYKDDDDVIKYLPRWKEDDINLKTKNKIEEKDDENNSESNDDSNQNNKDIKLIKVYKFNYQNYCYASKIRKKINENDSENIQIQSTYKTLKKDKKEEKEKEEEKEEDNDKIISKEDLRENIINNDCYYDKDIIKKDIYNDYINYYKSLKEHKIYQMPILHKNNINNPHYIAKIRKVKILSKNEDINKTLNEKPINKLSLITKKRIKDIIAPLLDRTKLKINKCIITKEKKSCCLILPNPSYKNELNLITKKRKKIIQKPIEELKLPSEKNNKCLITKERKYILQKGILLPYKQINYIKKERKKLIEESMKIPLKDIYYIEKIRKKEILDKIKTIQNIFRAKNKKDNKDENLLYNNKDKTAFIPRIKNYYFNKDEIEGNDQDNYIFEGYISKINKQYIYKIEPSENCFISKEMKSIIKKEQNYSFLSLVDFFIKKNIQEFVWPKLLPKEENNNNKRLETNYHIDTNQNVIELEEEPDEFTYPKYYKNLRRIFNFYKTKKREDSPEAQKIYDEIIPDIKDSKSLNELITKLNDNPENKDKLIDNQDKIVPKKQPDNNNLIDEIGEFVKYDKNLSNSAFIKNKLKENPIMKDNKNLLNIIKIVDDEYNNLINGKYCYKCGKEILKCKCDDINYIFKETENAEENDEEGEEDNLDFDMDDDDETKSKTINYFEYDTNKTKGLQMINKPRLEDYISEPKKVLQIYNKNQLNEINKNIRGTRNHLNKESLKLMSNNSNLYKSSISDNNYNLRYSSYSNNNINNSITSNNEDNILGSNNKNFLSSNNFNK